MPETVLERVLVTPGTPAPATVSVRCRVAVIWIDWYAYHVARFVGLSQDPLLAGSVAGIEMVGGIGVHAGLRFREELPAGLAIETLFPQENWQDAGQVRIARRLWQRLSALRPEVVLVPGYYTLPAIAAALWARLHGRTSVLMTESTREDHQRSSLKEKAKSLLVRGLFDWAVAGGSRHRSYLQELGFPEDRIARYYDVVDNQGLLLRAQQWRQVGRAAANLPERYFLYVGRLAPEKNLRALLDAYCAHRAGGGRWPLVLVGDGPERRALEQQAATCPFGADILFAGHQGSAELPRFYAFAGCFVLPSTREPWGLVVNEAMACGLPVIVSNRCGSADDLVRAGDNGFIFDPFVNGELAACLSTIESLPEEQWKTMGICSMEQIAQYSPETFGEQIAHIVSARK